MRVTDAIKQLEHILEKDGDLEVVAITDFSDVGMGFRADHCRHFETVIYTCEHDEQHHVCAFLEAFMNSEPTRPNLTLIKEGAYVPTEKEKN